MFFLEYPLLRFFLFIGMNSGFEKWHSAENLSVKRAVVKD